MVNNTEFISIGQPFLSIKNSVNYLLINSLNNVIVFLLLNKGYLWICLKIRLF